MFAFLPVRAKPEPFVSLIIDGISLPRFYLSKKHLDDIIVTFILRYPSGREDEYKMAQGDGFRFSKKSLTM